MKTRTIYDILHTAERMLRKDGLTDNNYITAMAFSSIGEKGTKAAKGNIRVTKFSAGSYNASDIRVDYHLAVDRIFLHDVHANLAYVFRAVEGSPDNFIIGAGAQKLITRAKELRMSLNSEVSLSSQPTLRGNALQRVLRLGKDYLKVLDLFYAINAITLADSRDLQAIVTALFRNANANNWEDMVKNSLALAHLIPAEAIEGAIHVNNMLTGAITVTGDVDDDVIH